MAPTELSKKNLLALILNDPWTGRPSKASFTHCQYCNIELIGRKGRKFCCQKCHDAFNNQIKRAKRKYYKQVLDPLEKNDRYLESFYRVDPDREWPMEKLDNPNFDGEARPSRIKDDDSPYEGLKYLRYSIHENPATKKFKILYHG
jgi:hypothetical protein